MPCTHPPACEALDPDDNPYCAWCEQVERLQSENDALRAAMQEKAVIVYGGNVKVDGPIGYLALYGGTVGTVGTAETGATVTNRLGT
jgi:hypothetical protein